MYFWNSFLKYCFIVVNSDPGELKSNQKLFDYYTVFQKYQKALKFSQFVNQKSSKTEQSSVSGSVSHKIFDDDVNGTQNDVNSFRYHLYIT